MRMIINILIVINIMTCAAMADGLMMPVDDNYPKDFLRSRLTKVEINIDGVIARTSVYQEFVNEWDKDVDAVYSFPLPPDARATQFIYWYEDKIYRAVLKVSEQATNPGTGEGGIVAEVNKYIGRNGIKIALKGIPAGKIQKVQLDYIQLVEYYRGSCTVKYPLAADDFITYPLDHLEFNVHVRSNSVISGFDIPDFSDFNLINSSEQGFSVQVTVPKAYLNKDFELTYHSTINKMTVDFYSVSNDTVPGHFGLFLRPPNQVPADSLLPRRIIFLLSNSSQMFGYKLNQSIAAIENIIDEFSEEDEFNIGVFNNYTQFWRGSPVTATGENIESAKAYLAGISNSYGSNMQTALEQSLNQITDSAPSNSIVIFSDGYSYLDPVKIGMSNTKGTGIFPIAIGDNFNFARLEMLAAYNYGFVTYIGLEDNLNLKMSQLMGQITQPILKEVALEYGSVNLSDLLPEKIPSAYAGTYFFMTGRYENPGSSALSIGGTSSKGPQAYDFLLDFSAETTGNKFIESLWAKQMIEYLEWQIEIYGETTELKAKLIEISLTYNIRCRYTAYIADYETEYSSLIFLTQEDQRIPAHSHLVQNYPNPFNPVTKIVFYISPDDVHAGVALIRIYNSLGQLVYVIDLRSYGPGYHEIVFNGTDWHGNPLSSGVYFAVLQVGAQQSMMRMTLLR